MLYFAKMLYFTIKIFTKLLLIGMFMFKCSKDSFVYVQVCIIL